MLHVKKEAVHSIILSNIELSKAVHESVYAAHKVYPDTYSCMLIEADKNMQRAVRKLRSFYRYGIKGENEILSIIKFNKELVKEKAACERMDLQENLDRTRLENKKVPFLTDIRIKTIIPRTDAYACVCFHPSPVVSDLLRFELTSIFCSGNLLN